MFRMIPVLMFAAVLALPMAVSAQQKADPALPATLQNLAAKGAQVRYLGREKGLDGWITVMQGQEQYFYATPDGEAILMGLLFDKNGKMLTVRQVQNLQQGNDPTLENLIVEKTEQPAPTIENLQAEIARQADVKTSPSEKLFAAIEGANWVVLGNKDAPAIYAFIDPQCPHCHAFIQDIRKDFLDAGQLQLRMIPVGFREDTKSQAAVLLASATPQDTWFRHMDGDATALPVSSTVNKQAVEMNMSVMQTWKLDATPMIVYRSAKGEVKIIRGRPKTPLDILADLR